MIVTIWSHFRDEEWTGNVPDADLPLFGGDESVNEALFRAFNRVDEADCERLEAWGYQLPSLSVDDTVTWQGRTFRVDGSGFSEIHFDGSAEKGVVA